MERSFRKSDARGDLAGKEHGAAPTATVLHGPLARTAAALAASPRVRQLVRSAATLAGQTGFGDPAETAAMAGTVAPVQRKVKAVRGSAGKWHTTADPKRHFDTELEARAHEDALLRERERKRQAKWEARQASRAAKHALRAAEYAGAEMAPHDHALLYTAKGEGKKVPVHRMEPGTAKKRMEKMVIDGLGGQLKTSVLSLGGAHFVADPGHDLAITPASHAEGHGGSDSDDYEMHGGRTRPRGAEPRRQGGLRLIREGKAAPYRDLGPQLDKIARALAAETGRDIADVNARMGKDIDRLSRGAEIRPAPEGLPYDAAQMHSMRETAVIMRVDKGRAPAATAYIRQSFASGKSFTRLLVGNAYVGAPKGGAKELKRTGAENPGEESSGSDVEDAEIARAARLAAAKERGEPGEGAASAGAKRARSLAAESDEESGQASHDVSAIGGEDRDRASPSGRDESEEQPRKRKKLLAMPLPRRAADSESDDEDEDEDEEGSPRPASRAAAAAYRGPPSDSDGEDDPRLAIRAAASARLGAASIPAAAASWRQPPARSPDDERLAQEDEDHARAAAQAYAAAHPPTSDDEIGE